MALMVQERPAFDGLIEEIEASRVDVALLNLLSLLEEPCCQEFNDEQLNGVIRSLEEVICVDTLENHDFAMKHESVNGVNRDYGNLECNFDYFDELNKLEMVPSSPVDDMNWYVEYPTEEMDHIMEFYSQNFIT